LDEFFDHTGYDRIVGAMANLGYTLSDQTVGNILQRNGIPTAPVRKRTTTWADFIRAHMSVLAGTDFFSVEVLTLRGLVSWCHGPANVCSHACLAIGQTMPGIVGIFTQQILQDRRLTRIEAQRKQLPPMPRYAETLWLCCESQINDRQMLPTWPSAHEAVQNGKISVSFRYFTVLHWANGGHATGKMTSDAANAGVLL
jgi:hypothetical protein